MLPLLLSELRLALRSLRRSAAYAVGATVTLGLGVAATLVTLGLVDLVVLRTLQIRDPQSLVAVSAVDKQGRPSVLNIQFVESFAHHTATLATPLPYLGGGTVTVEAGETIFRSSVAGVSSAYFDSLGLVPSAGTWWTPEDDTLTESASTAVVSFDLSRRHFGSPGSAVGALVRVEGAPFRVVGVLPATFHGVESGAATDIMVPIESVSRVLGLPPSWPVPVTQILARLQPGATLASAAGETQALWRRALETSVPAEFSGRQRELFLELRPRVDGSARGVEPQGSQQTRLLVAMAAFSWLVLCVTCVNVAALMFARYEAKLGESALRQALGATFFQAARPLALEAVLVVCGGAALAVPIAVWGRTIVATTLLPRLPEAAAAAWDVRSLGIHALVVGLVLVVVAGIPLWRLSHPRERDVLDVNRRTHTSRAGLWSHASVGLQAAAAVCLVAAALAIGRWLWEAKTTDPGFETAGVILAKLAPRPGGYNSMNDAAYFRDLIDRIARSPSLASAALSKSMPVNGAAAPAMQPVSHAGATVAATQATLEVVSPGFVESLGAKLEAGREFAFSDTTASEPVAIITRTLADTMFPDGQSIDRFIQYGGEDRHQRLRVVGVIRDLAFTKLDVRAPRVVFVSWFQQPPPYARWPVVIGRYRDDAARAIQDIRAVVGDLGREYVETSRTLQDQVDLSVSRERVMALTAGLFAALAAGLLLIGVSASLWQDLDRTRRERAVRLALGARPEILLWSTIRTSGTPVAIGGLGGAPFAVAALAAFGRYIGLNSDEALAVVIAVLALLVLYGLIVLPQFLRALKMSPSAVLRED